MTDHARQRILLRRAQFVTAALAALSPACSKVNDVPHADPSNKPMPPPASATASSQPEAALPDGLPPLDIPAGVSAIARTEFERLATKVRAIHEDLAKAANGIPSCNIADEACKKSFREVADRLVEAEQGIHEMGPRCPGKSKDAKLVDARVEQHRAFAKERLEKIRKKLAAKLDEQGPAANKAWADIFDTALHANPEPCLKYACPEW